MRPSYSGAVSQVSRGYVVTDRNVSWGGKNLEDVDVKTFTEYAHVWGADRGTVYTEWRPRRIDRGSFEFLNPVFVRDADHVYDYHGIVDGADPKDFKPLDAGICSTEGELLNETWIRGYGKDDSNVYFHDQMTGKASALRGANPERFVSYGNCYGSDDASVYFEKLKLPGVDPKTWVYLGRNYSADARGVYYFNRRIPGVSNASFKVLRVPNLPANYATDGRVFLQNDTPIPEAQFDHEVCGVFKKLEGHYAVFRKNHAYLPPTEKP